MSVRRPRTNVPNWYRRLTLIVRPPPNTVNPQATQIVYSEGVNHGTEVMAAYSNLRFPHCLLQ